MKTVLSLLILGAQMALAGPPLFVPKEECEIQPLHKVDFFLSERALSFSRDMQVFAPAARATFKFVFPMKDKELGRCSGFFTSNNGHFSSALHCFQDCLLKQGYLKNVGVDRLERTAKPFPAECPIEYGEEEKITKVQINLSADCFDIEEEGCKGHGDFVMGEIKHAVTNCVKVNVGGFRIGEQAVAVGYPKETEGREFNSDGKYQQFSNGLVIDNNIIHCLKVRSKDGLMNPRAFGFGSAGLPLNGLQRLSTDITQGNSGGPIVDKNGSVIGIAAAVTGVGSYQDKEYKDYKDFECLGSGHMYPMKSVLENAKKHLSSEQFQAATTCDDSESAQQRVIQEKLKNTKDPWKKLFE